MNPQGTIDAVCVSVCRPLLQQGGSCDDTPIGPPPTSNRTERGIHCGFAMIPHTSLGEGLGKGIEGWRQETLDERKYNSSVCNYCVQ
jgi:hypothetical protein